MTTKPDRVAVPSPPPGSVTDEWVTPEMLAGELHISLRTLRHWHRLRIGPPRTAVGKVRLYRKAAVQAWLASRETAQQRTARA